MKHPKLRVLHLFYGEENGSRTYILAICKNWVRMPRQRYPAFCVGTCARKTKANGLVEFYRTLAVPHSLPLNRGCYFLFYDAENEDLNPFSCLWQELGSHTAHGGIRRSAWEFAPHKPKAYDSALIFRTLAVSRSLRLNIR